MFRTSSSVYDHDLILTLCVGKLYVLSAVVCVSGYLTFRHRASCILGQVFHHSPANAFYIFNQQIYFII